MHKTDRILTRYFRSSKINPIVAPALNNNLQDSISTGENIFYLAYLLLLNLIGLSK